MSQGNALVIGEASHHADFLSNSLPLPFVLKFGTDQDRKKPIDSMSKFS